MSTAPRTVHLITVGVSLFDKLQGSRRDLDTLFPHDAALAGRISRARNDLHDPKQQEADAEAESAKQAAWLREVTTPGSGTNRQELEELLKRIAPAQWPARASAELSTLAAYNPHSNSITVPAQDTAILISSDTGRGMRAALFNAAALAGGNLNRVRYLHEPSEEVSRMRGDIVIARLPGLDVGAKEGFTEAMRGLGRIGRGVDRLLEPAKDVARFHLSGGFKAALPFLLGLGEALRGLRGPVKVRAFALHELAPRLRSIELPLRSFPSALLKDQLAGTDEDGGLVPPADLALNGFAYELQDNGVDWKLTPFGEALRELHRDRPETET